MELPKQPSDAKKSKPSFWNRLLRLPRKSSYSKGKHESSFNRQDVLYSSLGATKRESSSIASDESENFTILEANALQDVHRDAGILFLNKSSFDNCFTAKEENRHVQFAPTPMNKYYKVDVKSAPSTRKQLDEDKENSQHGIFAKPARPILRIDKDRKTSSAEDSIPETRLVNVSYVDGPSVKTPTIPRTSTKIALVDRKNGSMPQLNVSSIVKYNSLPRNPKIIEEGLPSKENVQFSQSVRVLKNSDFIRSQTSICPTAPAEQRCRRSMRSLSSHRQSCYGVSDPSRVFEGKKILQAQNRDLEQDVHRRLSLGPPLNYNLRDAGCPTQNINPKIPVATQKSQKKYFNLPLPPKSQSYARSLDQPVGRSSMKHGFPQRDTNRLNKPLYHASTGHLPNRAINEVGLPIAVSKRGGVVNCRPRSKSPHYIALSEACSSNKFSVKNTGSGIPNHFDKPLNVTEFSEQTSSRKPKESSCLGSSVQNKKQSTTRSMGQSSEFPSAISETRKQAILSAMYNQKRKLVNKICKYNSKQSDEGFSSMADDECSFNCSCSSCETKLARNYKRSGLKQLFSSQGKDKYFFMIEPEIKEGNELERLPENQTFEGPMALAQPHLSSKNEADTAQNKTWYDCNDTLCQTPGKCSSPEKFRGKELPRTPTNKMVENIYENITQIINSATKKNLTPQDVKRLLSTPISSPLKSQKITQRNLFPDENCMGKPDQVLTPAKSSDCFNDSIVLLQEIFQKLSQECKELLQPNLSSSDQTGSTPISQDSPSSRYVNDLMKNLKSSELSESDFANIIGGIAQNIFSDTKARKGRVRTLVHSASLPDLQLQQKASLLHKAINVAQSLRDLCNLQIKGESKDEAVAEGNVHQNTTDDSVLSGDSALASRQLPDGWSRTPTTENSNLSDDVSNTKLSSSGTDKDSSKYSEGELQLLENAIRVGMGLAPVDKVKKTPLYASSPTKATKYKSRDVLSGKGKLKLKIYYNSGLVTVYVMKAAKLDWANGRTLNAYVKLCFCSRVASGIALMKKSHNLSDTAITMIPDECKRVHWRTNVQKSQKNPVFNQKFSFELLAEDVTKRLVFSVWHRDYAKQRSELIGCMSFSIRHVMGNTHNVDGWYRLLRERFGTQKHFAAHAHKDSCSFVK